MEEMEVDSVSDQKLPFDLWRKFKSMFTFIMDEEADSLDEHANIMSEVLSKMGEQEGVFSPFIGVKGNTISVDYYKEFTIWIIGQLVKIISLESFTPLHNNSIHSQTCLLEVLSCQNTYIYECAISAYANFITKMSKNLPYKKWPIVITWCEPDEYFCTQVCSINFTSINISINDYNSYLNLLLQLLKLFNTKVFSINYLSKNITIQFWNSITLAINNTRAVPIKSTGLELILHMLASTSHRRFFQMLDDVYELLLNTISIVCNDCYASEEFNGLQNIISNIFETIRKSGPICGFPINMEIIKIVSKLLLSEKIKVSNQLSESMCNIIKSILEDQMIYSTVVLEKLPINRLIDLLNLTGTVELLEFFILQEILQSKEKINKEPNGENDFFETNTKEDNNLLMQSSIWHQLWEKLSKIIKSTTEKLTLDEYQIINAILRLARCLDTKLSWETYQLFQNINIDKLLEKILVYVVNHVNYHTLETLITSCGSLICLKECISFPPNNVKTLIAVLTLPWASTSNSIVKTLSFYKHLNTMSIKYSVMLKNTKIMQCCLMYISQTNENICFDVREKIIFASFSKTDLCKTSLRNLPFLFHRKNNHNVSALFDVIKQFDDSTIVCFVQNLRILLCAMYGKTVLLKNKVTCREELFCIDCDNNKFSSEQEISPHSKIYANKLNEFWNVVLLSLVNNSTMHIRCEVIKMMPKIINHFQPDNNFKSQMLTLIQDKNESVRIQCSKVLNYVIFEKDPTGDLQIDDSLFIHTLNILCTTANDSLTVGNNELQYSCIETIFNIGCVPIEMTILPSIQLMFLYLIHPNSSHGSIAKFYMTEIAAAHNTKFLVIFDRYENNLMQYIANNLVACYETYYPNIDVKKTYIKLGFTHRDLYAVKQMVKYIFPWCIKKPTTRKILSEIASLAQKEECTLLKESFKYCFSHLLLSEEKNIWKQGCQLIEEITNTPLKHLIRLSYTPIIAEILTYLHSKNEQAKEAIKMIQVYDVLYTEKNNASVFNFAEFLSPRFLGLLMVLESRLIKNSPDSIKENILLSLGDIFKLMGSRYVTPARFKILAMLRTAISLKSSTFVFLGLKAWDSFIHCVHMEALGPMLSTIFVSIMPLLDIYPNKVANMFYFMIKENQSHLKQHIAELYFLEPHPANPVVYDIVQQYAKSMFKQPLHKLLMWLLDIVTHKTLEVKLHGLRRLHNELSAQQSEVTKLILSSENVNSVVIKLLEVLTENLRHQDKRVRLASSECLGKIGALDPSYLPNNIIKKGQEKKCPLDIKSNLFAIRALTVLGQGLQSARNSRHMDSFAVAIQQILQAYNVQKNAVIWSAIPSTLHEVIDPLSSSRYTLESEQQQSGIPHPIFGSTKSVTLNIWAYNWVNRLVPLITDSNAQQTFIYCKSSIRSDNEAMLLFLPYILLYAIQSANDSDGNLIYEELLAVINNDLEDVTSSNNKNQSVPGNTQLSGRQIALEYESAETVEQQNETTTRVVYVKTAFTLFDFLFKWTREQKASKNEIHKPVSNFLSRFCKLKLAEKSLEYDEYPRALMYLEDYINENKNKLQDHLPSLSRIYSKLNDADSLKGIIAVHYNDPSPEEMILLHEVNGQLQDAAACYEKFAQMSSDPSLEYHKGMVKCYLGIDQPFTALKIAEGLTNVNSDYKNALFGEKAEAIWSLMKFDELEDVLVLKPPSAIESWGACIGQALVFFLHKDQTGVQKEILSITNIVMESLYKTMVGSAGYKEAYPFIVKLHILNEMEQIFNTILHITNGDNNAMDKLKELITYEMDERLQCLQPQAYVLQQVLCMRRVVLTAAQKLVSDELKPIINHQIGISWLKSIKVARKSLNFQQAYSNILAAEKYKPTGLFLEKAKLLWKKSDQGQAISTLKKGVNALFPNLATVNMIPCDEKVEERKTCASALLLLSKYNDKTANVDMETNLVNIESAYKMFEMWEKSLVRFAHYQDRLLNTMAPQTYYTKGLTLIINVVNCYGMSLQYGCEYIYQSMPKLLSIWLDFGSDLNRDIKKKNNKTSLYLIERKRAFTKMIKLIEGFVMRLPTFMFLTAFSQITSRICHPMDECFKTLTDIIVKCILDYPNHSLWMLMTLHKSPFNVRVSRFNAILKNPQLNKVKKLLLNFQELFENLSELCNSSPQNVPVGVNFSLQKIAKNLPRLLTNGYFSNIMVPAQKFRTLVLPRIKANCNAKHNPFPEDLVYINGIKDEVYIYSSLQKPKRIIIQGSDGNEYPMMCKPKDDIRIDSRLMEFNTIVNMYLKRDPEARDRNLYIKTYSVVPMILDCGLIELVQNVVTMRSVILNNYEAVGIKISKSTYQGLISNIKDPLDKKRSIFLNKALPNHPPVFRNWYLKEFPSPGEWYVARNEFTRTTAVMSIVGYILGLGDRHGENILLDSTNGGVVHVDFNCLFNRGEKFEWPERVPFRLTHNMVDAMGTGGLEGMLSSACEITNRVMRSHTEQLVSVLKPFLYDPLVMWTGQNTKADENSEMTNDQAKEHLNNIELRLQGYVRANLKNSSMALSVAGQTRKLIEEATSVDNLCQMYIGWSAFL
ncbi:serine/threonine-protein kinase ATR [Adelges cooleyi]|uniref:serine/threonine-protein kinase ATR n=1 Tax=Adelges cooleyi TaxID=133065 RepID=UPI00217F5B69|nr:serine/threonine-protein kinase ATR [Adelges cooleyi]